MSAKIKHDLQRERAARNDSIRRAIATQHVLLQALSQKLRPDALVVGNGQIDWLVTKPIAGPVLSNPERWRRDKQTVLTALLTIDQLTDAS